MKKKYNTPQKTRNYSVRFDLDLRDFIESQPNKSELINRLVRQEKERTERVERIKVRQALKNIGS